MVPSLDPRSRALTTPSRAAPENQIYVSDCSGVVFVAATD
jgi:hypothetical protein